jgi:pimeloyl-ACP methyl ester carboxylesterase
MKTTFVPFCGANIAVHDTDTTGPAVVFVHGNSCSSGAFQHQLQGTLAAGRRLLAIDLPGHGDAAPAREPRTYTMPGHAAALVAVARELAVTRAVFVGWSLGGHVLLEAVRDLPDAAGLLIFGTPPLASPVDIAHAFHRSPATAAAFRERSSDAEIDAFLSTFFRPDTPVPAQFREDFLRTDGRARAELAASIARGDFADEVAIVRTLKQPLAILHGVYDGVVQRTWFDTLAMPSLWRGTVQEIGDAGHAPQWEAPTAFDDVLSAFCRDCRSGRMP